MRLVVLYRPNTESAGRTADYVTEYQRLHDDRKIELMSLDTPEGDNLSKIYGITSNPAILAINNEGSLVQLWQSDILPLYSELDAYLH